MPFPNDYPPEPFEDMEGLKCNCGTIFTWTKGEQEFMQDLYDRGKIKKIHVPTRCKACRLKKKQGQG